MLKLALVLLIFSYVMAQNETRTSVEDTTNFHESKISDDAARNILELLNNINNRSAAIQEKLNTKLPVVESETKSKSSLTELRDSDSVEDLEKTIVPLKEDKNRAFIEKNEDAKTEEVKSNGAEIDSKASKETLSEDHSELKTVTPVNTKAAETSSAAPIVTKSEEEKNEKIGDEHKHEQKKTKGKAEDVRPFDAAVEALSAASSTIKKTETKDTEAKTAITAPTISTEPEKKNESKSVEKDTKTATQGQTETTANHRITTAKSEKAEKKGEGHLDDVITALISEHERKITKEPSILKLLEERRSASMKNLWGSVNNSTHLTMKTTSPLKAVAARKPARETKGIKRPAHPAHPFGKANRNPLHKPAIPETDANIIVIRNGKVVPLSRKQQNDLDVVLGSMIPSYIPSNRRRAPSRRDRRRGW